MRLLTLDDAQALERVPGVVAVTPNVWGNSEVSANGRLRRTTVQGVGPEMPEIMKITVQGGSFSVDGSLVITDTAGRTANITLTDVLAGNGVIHVIDRVILPAL